jgi:hypothetical protein
MRVDNRADAPYTIDEACDVLMESVLQFKKQVQRKQGVEEKHGEQRTRSDWIHAFSKWLYFRELEGLVEEEDT